MPYHAVHCGLPALKVSDTLHCSVRQTTLPVTSKMVFSYQNLLGVTTFVLVFLVKGVDCWTVTYGYAAAGAIAFIFFLAVSLICCCVGCSRPAEERQPARGVVVVRTVTQRRVVDTSNIPTNPYNAGYGQLVQTSSNPPTYNQISIPPATGNPSSSDPYNTGYDQGRYV
ncbi:uncharacterized protein LOC117329402 [Pecten maximus]|uniref:uncharacterized protein LOC117329402 n=1 Tax=Pecten maximus TaxID=6579 RepID=UPI0014589A16|nr:uncharacterized protein LOC117329402 [Pecten maximus]